MGNSGIVSASGRGLTIGFSFVDTTRFDEFGIVFDETMTPTMQLVTEKVAGDAIRRASVDRGFFRQSIQPIVEKPAPGVIVGAVFSTVPHAAIIEGVDEAGSETEFGRRPGAKFPPLDVLRVWVERVITPPEEKIDEVTYLVGRKIVREGIKPLRPIGNAFRDNLAWISTQLDQAIEETLARL